MANPIVHVRHINTWATARYTTSTGAAPVEFVEFAQPSARVDGWDADGKLVLLEEYLTPDEAVTYRGLCEAIAERALARINGT